MTGTRTVQLGKRATIRPTTRARDLLDFIAAYIDAHRVAPSYREMADALGLVSVGRIGEMLDQLEQRGHIRRLHDDRVAKRARAIELVDGQTFRLPRDVAARICANAAVEGATPDGYLASLVGPLLCDNPQPF